MAIAQLPKLRKAELVEHLQEFHGNARSATPIVELKRWSVLELNREHEHLAGYGPCSLVNVS